jgi:hypothetical protein
LHLPRVCPLNGFLGQPLVTVWVELPQYTIDTLEKQKPPSILGSFSRFRQGFTEFIDVEK